MSSHEERVEELLRLQLEAQARGNGYLAVIQWILVISFTLSLAGGLVTAILILTAK